MICPECGCNDRVMRTIRNEKSIIRERRCPKCGHRVRTSETEVPASERPKRGRKKKKPAQDNRPEPVQPKERQAVEEQPTGMLAQAMANAK